MGHFEELYPGRFLKGVTLLAPKTIRIVEVVGNVELEGDDGAVKSKAVLRYKDGDKHKDKPGEIVWVRTNAQLAAVALNEPDYTKWGGRLLTIHHDKTVAFGKEKKGGIRVLGSPDMTSSVEVAIKMPRRKHPLVYVLQPTGKSGTKQATGPAPTSAQLAEAKRLRTKLDDLNPELAERLWSEHREPYTETQYQTLIEKLAAEVQSAEGGPA
jgi:hypothetical protein